MTEIRFDAATWASAVTAEVVAVPLFDDESVPIGLEPDVAAIVERMATEVLAGPRFGALSHFGVDRRVLVVRAGARRKFDRLAMHRLASAAVKALWTSRVETLAIVLTHVPLGPAEAAAAAGEGVMFALWRPELRSLPSADGSKPVTPLKHVAFIVDAGTDVAHALERSAIVGRAVNLSRHLVNEPANVVTPSVLAHEAGLVAKRSGLSIEVLDRDACRLLGMGAYLSVTGGSAEPPAFIVLRYHGRGGQGYDLGLIGKGVTFDSGGISIKQQEWMVHMKADMSGAAAVIAAMGAIGELGLPVDVIGVAPCTENLPSGSATKPGDVFTSMSGVTVEVRNTDGEGRLLLIDAVTYACRQGARRVVDIASLTLAVAGGYGDEYVGVFGEPSDAVDHVLRAADAAGERLWPLPISDEIRDAIKSDVADVTNSIGTTHGGGALGAAFIERGVEGSVPWAHLDLGRTYWSDVERPYSPKGPLGAGVRTLVALAESATDA